MRGRSRCKSLVCSSCVVRNRGEPIGSRALRSRQVSAEEKLWEQLRNRRLSGSKFVRQLPVGSYFGDFVCRERKLIVEVDGATHGRDVEIANDAVRTSSLEGMGIEFVV